MSIYNIVASTDEATVVAEYAAEYNVRPEKYQSEAELEREFIRQLTSQGYEYISVHNEASLIENLRKQLELLNDFTFTDSEWDRFFTECIANTNEGIVEKTRKIQDDHIQILKREDGTTKNIYLLDKKNIHNNRLQVINQYEEAGGKHETRYDVTILVNGLPLVHVELKRRGVAIREAFNQIKRYQRDSFWAASGLFEYVQIFVISNGTHTKYYSNTTRNAHIKEQSSSERRRSKKTSNSFEFTSFWADANNKIIPDLVDFTKTFFAKHTLLNILTKYCIFTSEDLLLVMRPYQIAAAERILSRIVVSTNYKKMGTTAAGGYIWHTTGSGKTLTSFKTAQLASALPYIDKVLFVVDRKDLDYQTMKEYDRFEKGAANGNTSTRVLQRQLEDRDEKGNPHEYKIIVTTIQKLDIFIRKNKQHDIYKKHVVLIFDECHRSQFGEMHQAITKSFKNYHIFGFTGTPIFAANASSGGNPLLRTTEQAFGEKLHTYTIVDAINDGNVLPFRIDFINTIKMPDYVNDKKVYSIDREKALADPQRISEIVSYVLEHFDQKTKRNSYYTFSAKWEEADKHNPKKMIEKRETRRVAGFNSIFAAASIPMAIRYYNEFKKQIAEKNRNLTIATIFSFSANEEEPDGLLPEEDFNMENLDQSSRDFLDAAIRDYNSTFSTNYDTSSDKFQNYYKDLSLRVKNREIDILIVVNMFLTGFDATTLNTLWVDKNLRQHGLIQAFSRTNRILNSVKTYGNIVCFRDLKEETDKAIALFGNKDAGGIVLLKTFDEYYKGYDEKGEHKPGYAELIATLTTQYPLGQPILGEEAEKDFIRLYGAILRLRNILTSFDDFEGNEILSERDFQDYQSIYIDLYQEYRKGADGDKETINDDIVFEIELVKQIEVNIDYILMLVAKYQQSNCKDKTILTTIDKAINSSIELRSKKELIERFIEQVNVSTKVDEDWRKFLHERKEADISAIIEEEKLKPEETRRFIDNAFRDGMLKTTGTAIDKIMPPVSRFGGGRAAKKQGIIEKLMYFFEKYLGLV
ncbi:type I restriction endonuclease subunit R [Aneurinibacillus aneurinilyticus]|uniref:Type I restriction enzyme endonuclease subunit n=1 Tax=Aneurinibacillus aneurinilyticus ATCC 12856 TaxID=649747 RepID=U1YKN6_ANEAE|nr:type I restriction endonuclease subunit R [Aneurinibacillus aneurinilyticus]ERI11331.1 type I site-specific deoxyribonuclease, HsdR family [Aneurinibacillus aneurinilyticus ATCC 12856]MED0708657.1 type I restriction endonuclease subunit R [Aneurinibacillus aneurinilyticus]MED0723129.1 type I restriction endonuclease subunit R [Aneurinibacillus aneurinilyticus]MED0732334.1 type I restriction endonuclease subunit R [Aneurinibacillus aneurinilyticus]MED0743508.1 type I restriction endonuclease